MDYDKVSELIQHARASGMEIWLEGRDLRYRAKKGAAVLDVLPVFRQHKRELIEALAGPEFVPRAAGGRNPILSFYPALWEKTLTESLGPWFSNSTNWIVRMDGSLDVPALRQAIDVIVARHGILCCWVERDEQGYRFVTGTRNPLHVLDLTSTDGEPDADVLRRRVSSYVWTPFAAVGEPLFRSFVMHVAQDKHVLGFVVHHFIADSVSVATLADEITQAYSQILRGQAPAFAGTPLHYAHYVHAYNDWLQSGGFQIRLAYWREQLRGARASRLPPSHQSDAKYKELIRSGRLDVGPAATRMLRRFAAEHDTTLYVLLLAAKVHAMFQIDGAPEHLVLAMHDGRDDTRLAGMVGSCQNQLLLRITHAPHDTFVSTIRQVHRIWFEALEHQVPYHFVRQLLVELDIPEQFTELNAFDGGDVDAVSPRFAFPGALFAIDQPPPRRATPEDFGATSTMILARSEINIEVLYLDLIYDEACIQTFLRKFEDVLMAAIPASTEAGARVPALLS